MADLSERMWDLSDFLIITIGGIQQLSDSLHDRNHDHDVIKTAIRSQNPTVARAVMESHIIATPIGFEQPVLRRAVPSRRQSPPPPEGFSVHGRAQAHPRTRAAGTDSVT
jgi:hypothetical protein